MDVSFTKRTINIANDQEEFDLNIHFAMIITFGGMHSALQSLVSDHQITKFEVLQIFCEFQQKVCLIQFGILFHDTS
jgi:hypothetical protein